MQSCVSKVSDLHSKLFFFFYFTFDGLSLLKLAYYTVYSISRVIFKFKSILMSYLVEMYAVTTDPSETCALQ